MAMSNIRQRSAKKKGATERDARAQKDSERAEESQIAVRKLVEGWMEQDGGRAGRVLLLDAFVNEGMVDIDAVAKAFGLSKTQLAETLGVSREAFYKRARIEAPKTQARLREMLEILGRILNWAGTKEHAMAWYRSQPVSALGGRTAESLVKSGEATMVRDYLDHIAVGGYA